MLNNFTIFALYNLKLPTQDIKATVNWINAEDENIPESFTLRLRNGNSVEHAYKVLHFDELTQNAARVAAQTADAQAQARIKQKASRPSENGTSSQSARKASFQKPGRLSDKVYKYPPTGAVPWARQS